MKQLAWILTVYLTVVGDVSGQSYGDSWITMSPTGETLVCTVLQGGTTYCEVQK